MNHPILPMPNRARSDGNPALMGRIFVELGKFRPEDTERVLRLQREHSLRFGEAARLLGLVTESDIDRVLARQFSYPYLQPGDGGYPAELFAAYEPFGTQAEILRAVRAQLRARWFNGGQRALAIIAVDPQEGASFFCANLAVMFAQLGQQTLVLDANLRSPSQHRIFGIAGKHGLADILAARAGIETVARVEAFGELSVLSAGTLPPNPQELVGHRSFAVVLQDLSARFETVLLDVPAFSNGADALEIARRARGALLVVRKDRTRLASLVAVKAQLAQAAVQVVGSVLVEG